MTPVADRLRVDEPLDGLGLDPRCLAAEAHSFERWKPAARPCRWAGTRVKNDHLSDHRAVVAEPTVVAAS